MPIGDHGCILNGIFILLPFGTCFCGLPIEITVACIMHTNGKRHLIRILSGFRNLNNSVVTDDVILHCAFVPRMKPNIYLLTVVLSMKEGRKRRNGLGSTAFTGAQRTEHGLKLKSIRWAV